MAADTVLVCLCGCGQNEHHIGKKGCKHCPGCSRFRAAEELPVAAVEPAPAEGPAVEETDDTPDCCEGEPVQAADLDLARPDPGASTSARLREALDSCTELTKELFAVTHRLNRAEGERDDALGQLTGVQMDLADAREEIERLQGALNNTAEAYVETTKDLAAVDRIDALLDQADATGNPKIQHTSDTIRELIAQLREQLAEHHRLEQLRAELEQIAERAAEIRRLLADAEKPAAIIPDRTVRIWARENGYDVDARGRVSMELRAAYLQANPA